MEGMTFGTHPEPDIKRKRVKYMPTMGTALRTGVPLVDFDEGTPIPLGFVLQLPHELTPADITDAFSETVVLEHVLDGQTLDADHLVLVNDASRELVLIITTTISNLGVEMSDFETGLVAVLRPLLLRSQPPLGLGQLLLI